MTSVDVGAEIYVAGSAEGTECGRQVALARLTLDGSDPQTATWDRDVCGDDTALDVAAVGDDAIVVGTIREAEGADARAVVTRWEPEAPTPLSVDTQDFPGDDAAVGVGRSPDDGYVVALQLQTEATVRAYAADDTRLWSQPVAVADATVRDAEVGAGGTIVVAGVADGSAFAAVVTSAGTSARDVLYGGADGFGAALRTPDGIALVGTEGAVGFVALFGAGSRPLWSAPSDEPIVDVLAGADGSVITIGADVSAFDSDGTPSWNYALQAPAAGAALADDGTILVVGNDADDTYVLAIEPPP